MKVILSRKGFDSQYGGMPSPILPDGTLLSLPIPSKEDLETKYVDIYHGGQSYYDIIHTLRPSTKIQEKYACHLDPDLRAEAKARHAGWMPAFGQMDQALGHLRNQGVGVGDIFLFFGWFRQTEYREGKLAYVKGAPDLHVIYSYFEVGSIIDKPEDIPTWLYDHPHAKPEYWKHANAIYIAAPRLSLCPDLPGAGCLPFSEKVVLTKPGCSRSIWQLPDFFRQIPISYNANAWQGDCFMAAAKGQEFVFEANRKATDWVLDIIGVEAKNISEEVYPTGVEEVYIGVFHEENDDKKHTTYTFGAISQADYVAYPNLKKQDTQREKEQMSSQKKLFRLEKEIYLFESVFRIAKHPFPAAVNLPWELEGQAVVYIDGIKIAEEFARKNRTIYDVLYDFMAIASQEVGAEVMRVRVKGYPELVEKLLDSEAYILIGYNDGFCFEVDVEHFE